MDEFIARFKSQVNNDLIRSNFPEITDSETPVWHGSPSTISMADKYILAIIVLLVHIIFFLGEWFENPENATNNKVFSTIIWLVDLTGIFGFVFIMLLLTKINHYANFSTSGKWTTIFLLFSGLFPLLWQFLDLVEWISEYINFGFTNPLPNWNLLWFLPLGITSSSVMIIFTILYQKSFQYAITDKRIHIRKQFLYFDTSVHGISLQKVENLKADPTILGKIFGFGNVHIVTGSGVGLQVESLGVSVGISEDGEDENIPTGLRRFFLVIFGWISIQRSKSVMATDPSNCLYGIKNPMEKYRLINELMDLNVGSVLENDDISTKKI